MADINKTAYLSNDKDIISFTFGNRVIRFKGPYSLISFKNITEWDNGNLVVNAYYAHEQEAIEDYIDLNPILADLYIDPEEFLKPIQNVEVRNV